MNFLNALQICSSGLNAQRVRMNVISSNLANINTTRTLKGEPYKRKDVVFATQPVHETFRSMLETKLNGNLSEVKVIGITTDTRPPRFKYDPGHPDANEKGYVAMPNVTLVEEMVNMISATRSYDSGVTAIKATKNMALKALEIGR